VLIPALLELDVERLVIDLCSQDHRDVQVIHETLTKLAAWTRSRTCHV
jgi:hypothetical protein